jgi:hypothetical protein
LEIALKTSDSPFLPLKSFTVSIANATHPTQNNSSERWDGFLDFGSFFPK